MYGIDDAGSPAEFVCSHEVTLCLSTFGNGFVLDVLVFFAVATQVVFSIIVVDVPELPRHRPGAASNRCARNFSMCLVVASAASVRVLLHNVALRGGLACSCHAKSCRTMSTCILVVTPRWFVEHVPLKCDVSG